MTSVSPGSSWRGETSTAAGSAASSAEAASSEEDGLCPLEREEEADVPEETDAFKALSASLEASGCMELKEESSFEATALEEPEEEPEALPAPDGEGGGEEGQDLEPGQGE